MGSQFGKVLQVYNFTIRYGTGIGSQFENFHLVLVLRHIPIKNKCTGTVIGIGTGIDPESSKKNHPFCCVHCNKRYDEIKDLAHHIQTLHPEAPPIDLSNSHLPLIPRNSAIVKRE